MTVYLDNDFESEFAVTRKNTNTGAREAAAGLTTVRVRWATTPTGAAIHADLDKAATERTATAGTYFVIFGGDVLRTRLATFVGQVVYEIVGSGTNILAHEAHQVWDRRPIG